MLQKLLVVTFRSTIRSKLFLLLIVYKMALIPKQLMPNFKSGHGKVTTANLLIWFLEIRQFLKIQFNFIYIFIYIYVFNIVT